ncbi:MAG TPA: helix-turn-helix domain-containing protein [Azospirillaceae bacterium]|nr:helix-turn-helix domain-containing protein [Azospirillaceae bacterium]
MGEILEMTMQLATARTATPTLPAFLAAAPKQAAAPTVEEALLAHADEAVSFERDRMIFSEGDPAACVHIITGGMVRLCKMMPDGRRQIVGFLQAGDMMGLAMAARYLYSAEAVVPVTLRRLPRARLDALLDREPSLGRRLLSRTVTELQAAQDQMLLLGRKTAAERLASFLLVLARRAGTAHDGRCKVSMPMTRTDIGDFLGLTMETVSRAFTKLKTTRMIRLAGGHVVELLDMDALAELAEGC